MQSGMQPAPTTAASSSGSRQAAASSSTTGERLVNFMDADWITKDYVQEQPPMGRFLLPAPTSGDPVQGPAPPSATNAQREEFIPVIQTAIPPVTSSAFPEWADEDNSQHSSVSEDIDPDSWAAFHDEFDKAEFN